MVSSYSGIPSEACSPRSKCPEQDKARPPGKCLALKTWPKSHGIFRWEEGRMYFFKSAFTSPCYPGAPLLFSKDSCIAGAAVPPVGTTALFVSWSLLTAKNSTLCTEQVKEAPETTTLNCVIKSYIIRYMSRVESSQFHKKPYVSQLLILTL